MNYKKVRLQAVFSILFAVFLFPLAAQGVYAHSSPTEIESQWFNESAIDTQDHKPAFTTLFTTKIRNKIILKNTSETLVQDNLNLNIPSNATINGITVKMIKRVDRFLDGRREYPITDNSVRLVVDGQIQGDDKSSSTPYANTHYQEFSYGSDSDLWGTTLTASQINSSSFGVAYSVKRPAEGLIPQTLLVDSITVEVSYTTEQEIAYVSELNNCIAYYTSCNSLFSVPSGINVTSATLEITNTSPSDSMIISSAQLFDGLNFSEDWSTTDPLPIISLPGTTTTLFFNPANFNTSTYGGLITAVVGSPNTVNGNNPLFLKLILRGNTNP